MEGGSLQLAAYGKQDLYLTGNPQMTFFVGVYKRYTNFAIEQVREYFDGLFNFGRTTFCRISREGDLINRVFLYVRLPALQNNTEEVDACYSASWINSIGHALINKVQIEIGGVVIDTHYGQWLEIWNDLTLSDDKQDGYYDMVGKHEYFNSSMQGGEQVLYIPLQFWFCRNIGLSLPLVAIQQHDIRLIFDIRPFNECITTSDGILRGFDSDCDTPRIEEAFLYVDHIFLDDAERRAFVNNEHTYLIEQLQTYTQGLDFDTTNYQINLDFKLPTKEIIWIIRSNTTCNSSIPEFGNQLFNFSDRLVNVPGIPQDPMLSARLQLDGNDLFKERLNKFFREIQPYERHTRVPRNFIYVYSFALDPEDWRPTGTINLSRVDTFTVNMTIKPNLVKPQVVFYGVNYNILIVKAGMAGVKYLN